jgi:tetratricopeptide (TPR) repeat protein
MRATTLALAFASLLALSSQGVADPIADCNSDKPDAVIQGCSQLIDGGKLGAEAMAVAYFNRANAYDDSGDHDSAIADYSAAIKLQPEYIDCYFNRGIAYENKKDYDNAIADYTRVIALAPDYAKAYYGRARVYEDKGDFAQALAGYEEASRLAPNNAAVKKRIAEVKQKMGQ